MEDALHQHNLSSVRKIDFDLSFYSEESYKKDNKRPILKTPTIEILPSGFNQIGKSSCISEFKIDVSRSEWEEEEPPPVEEKKVELESTNTLARFAKSKVAKKYAMAVVDFSQMDWLLQKHEKMTVMSVAHSIPSACNIQPIFSIPLVEFGILSNVCLQNIYITKNFIACLSKVDLVCVMLSGQVAESGCVLTLTKNARVVKLDCTVDDAARKLGVEIPYGCRIDLFELYSSWVYNGKYGSIVNSYFLNFHNIPPESESMHTAVMKMILDIHPTDVKSLAAFASTFVNIVCNELLIHCHADTIDLAVFKRDPLVSFNARFLDSTERIPIVITTCPAQEEKDFKPFYSILENMRVKQFQINDLFHTLFFTQMKAPIPNLPVLMVEAEYGSPCVLKINDKLHKFLFLNVPNVTGTYQHHNVDSKNDGKYIPILDIPREFDVYHQCQVIFAFDKIPCGVMAHHPVIGADLEKFREKSYWDMVPSLSLPKIFNRT